MSDTECSAEPRSGRESSASRALAGRVAIVAVAIAVIALGVWFMPPPDGLTVQAWRLFTIFAAAIVSVVVNAAPILTASVIAV